MEIIGVYRIGERQSLLQRITQRSEEMDWRRWLGILWGKRTCRWCSWKAVWAAELIKEERDYNW